MVLPLDLLRSWDFSCLVVSPFGENGFSKPSSWLLFVLPDKIWVVRTASLSIVVRKMFSSTVILGLPELSCLEVCGRAPFSRVVFERLPELEVYRLTESTVWGCSDTLRMLIHWFEGTSSFTESRCERVGWDGDMWRNSYSPSTK